MKNAHKFPENMFEAFKDEPDVDKLLQAVSMLKRNPPTALNALERLAQQGSALSMVYLGDSYLHGRQGVIDLERGEGFLRQASENGSIEGAFRLAQFYSRTRKFPEAVAWLNDLTKRGFAPAMYFLG